MIIIFDKNKSIRIAVKVNYKETQLGDNLIYTIDIFNQRDKDVRDIILDMHLTEEVDIIKGEIQRERGILEFEGAYTGLIIGNLAQNEGAKVTLEVRIKRDDDIREIQCYAAIRNMALSNTVCTVVKLEVNQ